MNQVIRNFSIAGISLFFTAASALASGYPANSGAQVIAPKAHEEIVSVSDAYVTNGFDSGSDAFVVVNGVFMNTCYHWKEGRVKDTKPFVHEIRAVAEVKQGMCLMMLVPFNEDVRIGKLEPGVHTLKFMNGDGTYMEKHLVIED